MQFNNWNTIGGRTALITGMLFLLFAEAACHAPIKGSQDIRQAAKPSTLQVQVFNDHVDITVTSAGPSIELNENLRIEQWHNADRAWHFAACPLWMCATKETVFRKTVPSGGTRTVVWNRKLHDGCRRAGTGKYRIIIRIPEGNMLSDPAVFTLAD